MDISKIIPYADNVLVRLEVHCAGERLSPTGRVIIPETAASNIESQDAIFATVVAAGPGHFDDKFLDHERGTEDHRHGPWIPLDPAIVPGAKVILEKRALGADRVYGEGHSEYRMCRADCIAAIVED